ncbi:carboxyl-terminal processing protease [Proteiniborus ethanoligenes]|uniref:Carboxyl-terminal processing protease n=1 Tax=Proteiniborus ethanoligenes TaxID=415015 RepID=A0A1H3R627_9FIRM|nr:S41 family peptidase [Proteiniborus ethanoligenes]SDZ20973.1 carboxyl-terminal processing protease [Proteiniborus ethanoligenes]
MISKKRAVIIAVLLVLVTSASTFVFSNMIQISLKDKVIITQSEYNDLASVYRKYSKNILLEDIVKEYYLRDVDEDVLLEGQLKGLFSAIEDPYSVYMTKDEFKSFMEHTKGVFGGIGVYVAPGDDNLITVVSPIEDTPGERAGIKPGDKIIKVDGREFTADKMDEAVKHMKGEPGTEVLLTIMRKDLEGNSQIFDKNIKREEIRIKSVKSNMLKDNIGYIRIISFDDFTYNDFMAHLKELQNKGMKGLVLDLRNNPGGLLDISAKIADELMGEGTIVYTETKKKEREYLKSDKNKLGIPLTVLVNEGSASASEILSGALQDTKEGTIIGTTTFGKGVVQRIKELSDGSGFKITVSEYFTPNGRNIQGIGIEPDIIVEIPKDVEQIGVENLEEDTQLQKAIEVVKEKINK